MTFLSQPMACFNFLDCQKIQMSHTSNHCHILSVCLLYTELTEITFPSHAIGPMLFFLIAQLGLNMGLQWGEIVIG